MKRTRKLLCLVTLLLCFVVNGWADSVTLTQGTAELKKTTGTGGKTTIASFDNGKISIKIDVITDNINDNNNFKFDNGGTIVITPKEGVTVTNVKATGDLKGDFKVDGTSVPLTTETGYKPSLAFPNSTTITYSGSTKTTITQFTIEYTGGSTGETTKKNITIGNIEDKSIPVGESYDVTNPTAVEEGTSAAVAGSFSYTTTNTDIISIRGNTISGSKAGAAIVTATFTPDEGTKYNTPPTKTFTVTVTETGTSDTDVPAPMIKTLTYSTTKGIFADEEALSNGDGIPYYGCIAVNAAYAEDDGTFLDMSDKVSGIIFKFDDAETSWTKQDFIDHRVAGITTVSTCSALMTTEGHTSNLKLYVIAYHIKDGVRSYSDLVVRNYKYKEDTRKELKLKSSESPFTIELETKQGDVFTNTKTVTISATDANGDVDLSDMSFISRSSNRKLALSHMTLEGETETTANGNITLLMDNCRRSGVITVVVATNGNHTYRPTFMKVNVTLVETNVTPTDEKADYIEYTSIADLRAAGRAYRAANGTKEATGNGPKGKFVLKFDATNPASVVARFTNNEGKATIPANSIFITDNSGYGLWVSYEAGKVRGNFVNGQYNTEETKKPLVAGTAFTGTIVGTYRESESNIPEISEMKASQTIGGKTVTTSIVVDHSGEGVDWVGASIPVTPVADVSTIHSKVYTDNTGQKNSEEIVFGYRPYLNTVITVPGIIKKRDDGQFVLAQDNTVNAMDEKNALFITTNQLPEVNLNNYVGLEGVFTGLLFKRDGGHAKLVITRQAFFEAEQVAVFILDEQDSEGHVNDVYLTGALDGKVTVKIHRKGWTTDTWGTICLPFDMTADEFETTFGQGIDALAECTGTVENSALKFNVLTEKNIKAGVPYLIKVYGTITNGTGKTEADANYYATIADREIIKPVPDVVTVNYDKNPIIGTKFEFRGLFGKKTEASETNADGTHDKLAGNQKYQYISTKAPQYLHYLPTGSVNGFAGLRAYLYFPEWNTELNDETNPGTSTTNVLTISFVSEGATSISGIVEEGISDGKVFNLSGQYVGNSSVGLTKGIYIRNGKKFVVK